MVNKYWILTIFSGLLLVGLVTAGVNLALISEEKLVDKATYDKLALIDFKNYELILIDKENYIFARIVKEDKILSRRTIYKYDTSAIVTENSKLKSEERIKSEITKFEDDYLNNLLSTKEEPYNETQKTILVTITKNTKVVDEII